MDDKIEEENEPPTKKLKIIDNNKKDYKSLGLELKSSMKRIETIQDICKDSVVFLLDGKVWRRAKCINLNNNNTLTFHYLGWEKKYDENIDITNDKHIKRIKFEKPNDFKTEATIKTKETDFTNDLLMIKQLNKLNNEQVKQCLKTLQLKNNGDFELIRERLQNVIDEVLILNNYDPIIINMRYLIQN